MDTQLRQFHDFHANEEYNIYTHSSRTVCAHAHQLVPESNKQRTEMLYYSTKVPPTYCTHTELPLAVMATSHTMAGWKSSCECTHTLWLEPFTATCSLHGPHLLPVQDVCPKDLTQLLHYHFMAIASSKQNWSHAILRERKTLKWHKLQLLNYDTNVTSPAVLGTHFSQSSCC